MKHGALLTEGTSKKIKVFILFRFTEFEKMLPFTKYFFSRGGWLWANDVSVPRKVTPGPPGWNFLYSAQASFSWPRVDLARLSGRKNVMSMRELFRPDPLAGF